MEIYRYIKGYEGIYMISNYGNVWSCRNKRKLLIQENYNGYKITVLSVKGRRKTLKIHKAVIETFRGKMPINCNCIEHINHNSYDNRLSNLKYSTHSDNNTGYRSHKHKKRRTIVIDKDNKEMHFESITDAARYIKKVNKLETKIMSMVPEIRKCALNRVNKKTYQGYRFKFDD